MHIPSIFQMNRYGGLGCALADMQRVSEWVIFELYLSIYRLHEQCVDGDLTGFTEDVHSPLSGTNICYYYIGSPSAHRKDLSCLNQIIST